MMMANGIILVVTIAIYRIQLFSFFVLKKGGFVLETGVCEVGAHWKRTNMRKRKKLSDGCAYTREGRSCARGGRCVAGNLLRGE